MKKLFFVLFLMIFGFTSFSQNNDCPIQVPEFTFYYSKPLVLNQVIDTLFVCDPDVGQTHVWEITDPSGFWNITTDTDPNNAYLSVKSDLVNSDNKSDYYFTVKVTDQGVFVDPLSTTVTIHLVELNDSPIIADNQSFNIDENLVVGTIVGMVDAYDPNGQDLIYTIISGNDNNHFEINSNTGEISTLVSLNYEDISTYSLTIQVEDTGTTPKSTTGVVTINVNNVNEAPVIYRH